MNITHTTLSHKAWNKIKVKDHHGIVTPLSSIHTQNSSGIGEFYDLIALGSWCKDVGFDVIQLLPLNDTGSDSSPYNALSSCALNPIYLSLYKLPYISSFKELKQEGIKLRKLNTTKRIHYAKILTAKIKFLRKYFNVSYPLFAKDKELISFFKKEAWLDAYALFKTLKAKNKDKSWQFWDKDEKHPSEEMLKQLQEKHKEDIFFHKFLQFLCFKQLKHVHQLLKKNNIALMGDLPIFMSMESADVWSNTSIFATEIRAGAPPDQYEKEGQYWGFPLYRWDTKYEECASFWKKRLSFSENFYSIFRLDHIVGFFRVWVIEPSKTAKEGYFIPKDEPMWYSQGKKILKMLIESTHMLIIGEDLGQVPPFVKTLMQEFGVCSTKVMRWERNWDTDLSYINPKHYSQLSYSTLSTHDSSPLALWWKENREESEILAKQLGLDYNIKLSLNQRRTLLHQCHHSNSLFHLNFLLEYLSFIPSFVSKNPEEDRINRPGTINQKNWSYKMVPSLEMLKKNNELKKIIKSLLY